MEYTMTIPNLAQVTITNGRDVTVKSIAKDDPHLLHALMNGSCRGAMLHQRGHLVLSAAVVAFLLSQTRLNINRIDRVIKHQAVFYSINLKQ